MGLHPRRIDNLIEFLDKVESSLNVSDLSGHKKETLIDDLRLEVIEVLKMAFLEGDRTVRRSAVYGLTKIGLEQSLDFFIDALNDSDEHVRGWAAEALGRLHDPRSIIPLIKALADDNHYVGFNVAAALKHFNPDQIINQLVRALQDPDYQIRRRVCKLLGELGDQRVNEAIISALKDEEPGVRYEAAEALRKLENPASILPLISALNDQCCDVRTAAIIALGNFGDERAIEPLVGILIEQKDHRHASLEALRNLCGEENLELLSNLIQISKNQITETSNIILERIYAKNTKNEDTKSGNSRNDSSRLGWFLREKQS